MRKIKKALVNALRDYALDDSEFAETFWISRNRVSGSFATDQVYIASMVDLWELIDFYEIAQWLEDKYQMVDLMGEGGFLREVEASTWRACTVRVEPWIHVEKSEVWFPCYEHKWFLWDNEMEIERHYFDIYEDWEWDGKMKFSRKSLVKDGDRTMVPYGDNQHTEAELFYIIETLLSKIMNHPVGKISVQSLKFQLHQTEEEKTQPLQAIPTSSDEWVPKRINRSGSRKPKK